MNPDRDLDRLLDEWFADGPKEVADRVVVHVGDLIERQSQQPAWRLSWRDVQMNRNLRWVAAAAVLLVAVFAGTRLFQQPASSGVGASPTPSPSRPAPTATSAALSSTSGTTLLHAVNFDVPLSLSFGTDWRIAHIDKGVVDLLDGDVDMGIHSTALVTLPGPALTDPWVPVPRDFVAWIKHRPEFVPSAPRSVTIAGRTGTLVDADITWKDGTEKRDFLRYGTGAWLYDRGNVGHRARFIILPGPAGVGGLVIVMNAPGADFAAAATSLDAVLATIKFDSAP